MNIVMPNIYGKGHFDPILLSDYIDTDSHVRPTVLRGR